MNTYGFVPMRFSQATARDGPGLGGPVGARLLGLRAWKAEDYLFTCSYVTMTPENKLRLLINPPECWEPVSYLREKFVEIKKTQHLCRGHSRRRYEPERIDSSMMGPSEVRYVSAGVFRCPFWLSRRGRGKDHRTRRLPVGERFCHLPWAGPLLSHAFAASACRFWMSIRVRHGGSIPGALSIFGLRDRARFLG